MNSKVFVTQESNYLSFHDAERFGDIEFITNKEYSKHKSSITNRETIAECKMRIEKFNPERDFLLLSGDPILMGFVFHLAFKKAGYIKLLKWDKIASKYFEIHFKG
jgi:hypothetical protein